MNDPFRAPGLGVSPLLAHLAEVGDGRRRELPRDAAGLAWADGLPFPVRGYELWCLSEQPLFEVTLSVPIEQRQLVSAVAAVDPKAEIAWVDQRTARILVPPRMVAVGESGPEPYADPAALTRLVDELLVPLHRDVPIEQIDMGGAMLKR